MSERESEGGERKMAGERRMGRKVSMGGRKVSMGGSNSKVFRITWTYKLPTNFRDFRGKTWYFLEKRENMHGESTVADLRSCC